MLDFNFYFEYLSSISGDLSNMLKSIAGYKLRWLNNSDVTKWQKAVDKLPSIKPSEVNLDTDIITIGNFGDAKKSERKIITNQLLKLHPWRKGPFNLFDIFIDTEWRSNLKWNRLINNIEPLDGKLILDIGSGNGYYSLRMLGAGAKAVVAIDPFWLFVMQFSAINRYVRTSKAAVLPMALEDLPCEVSFFDTIFSMGVLYHRKNPLEHLNKINSFLNPSGELVLETLIIQDSLTELLIPDGRYAKMRNVWQIPSVEKLTQWLNQAGFIQIKVADITATTPQEQRKTEWMHFESLSDFLDKDDTTKTVEGYPAPVRAVITAKKAP